MSSDFSDDFQVPEGWSVKKLIDCTSDNAISYGIVQPGQHDDNGIPIIRVNNVNGGNLELNDVLRVSPEIEAKFSRTRLSGGEVLLTLVGSTGQSFVAPKTLAGWNVPRAIAVIRASDEIGADWVNICLQSKETKHFLDVRANTTVQKTLNLKDVREIPILIPPQKIKEKIEAISNDLAGKIQLNRQINQTLEQMAQAIFQSWFVNFEPVKAKIVAREDWLARQAAQSDAHDDVPQFSSPVCYAHEFADAAASAPATQADLETFMNRAAMCAISGKTDADLDAMPTADYQHLYHTASLFPDELVESELGEIPKGWEVATIDTVTSLIIDHRGKTPKKLGGDWSKSGYTALSAKHIKQGCIVNTDQLRYVEEGLYKKWMKEELCVGDILFTSEGPMGEMYYLVKDEKYCLSQRLYALRANKNVVSPTYLYYWMHTLQAKTDLAGRATGTTVLGIRQSELRKVRVLSPALPISNSFHNSVNNLLSLMTENEKTIDTLTALRDSLLPKLLSGELDISALTDLAIDTVVHG